MIGKITIGKSFRGCIAYVLNDKKISQGEAQPIKGRADVLMYNQCFGSERELTKQFNEVVQLNPRLSKPVLHITLSLPVGETIGKDKLMGVCQECAKEMGFERNQYFAVQHRDTKHQHIHIVANRIGFDRKTVSDSQNFQKIAMFCRRMEREHNLKQVLSPRRFLHKKERMLPRHDARKEKLRKDIQNCIKLSRGYPDFQRAMQKLGYQIEKGRGICFIDSKKVRVKGSEVGFPLARIEKMLSLSQNQAFKMIQAPHLEIGNRETKTAQNGQENSVQWNGIDSNRMTKLEIAKVPEQPVGDLPLKRKRKKKRQGLKM